jgi:23S rRNA (uracil1939-C5)-methyltransferase
LGARRKKSRALTRDIEVEIETLGARGDGIGQADGVPVYVPFTAPGDRVRARIEGKRGDGYAATALDFIARAPERGAPVCRHFGLCGGCAWQHLNERTYADLKRKLLIAALERQGLRGEVEPARISPPQSRRRVRFAGLRAAKGAVVGLSVRGTHEIVDLRECPVALPAIAALLDPCRAAARSLDALSPGRKPVPFAVAITSSDTGLDATWTLPRAPGRADRETLARFAETRDLARVSWRLPGDDDDAPGSAEPVALRRKPTVTFTLGGVAVEIPPDAFLQATAEGERAIQDIVAAAIAAAPKGRVADLFAGCGTLSLPLARSRAVLALDGNAEAIAALDGAARRAVLNTLKAERRDLARRPLAADELKGFAAAVFDPPQAGALAQARALAEAKLPVIVAVSCDPATLARDLKVLAEGGYALERVTPVDQFLWSSRIEAVAVMRRL